MKAFFKKILGFFTKKTIFFEPSILETNTLKDQVINDTGTGVTEPLSVSYNKLPLTVLKKLAPIRDLRNDELQKIKQTTFSYGPESLIFILGDKSDQIYYLLKGTVEFRLSGEKSYCIDETSTLANLPISSGKVHGATVVTKSSCTILTVPISVSYWWVNESRKKTQNPITAKSDFSFPKEVPNTPFFNRFSDACLGNKLSLPTLPQVAIQLRRAMSNNIGVKEAVKIIQLDAIIVTRLIQLANSALYASLEPVNNCHEAVSRLGLDATCQLVMSISMKQLFKSNSPEFTLEMQALWKKSVHISSLSFVVAQECGAVNPEDALLAGLICDIGAIPLINFAEKNADSCPDLIELKNIMPYLNPSVGSFLLEKLNFSTELIEIPKHAENWYYESGEDSLTLIDVVILAKFHSYLGTDKAKDLPFINVIPAYSKLKNSKLNPDFSLDIVTQSRQRINAAMRMLG